jgi:heme-degrading monooxygenase HmoA
MTPARDSQADDDAGPITFINIFEIAPDDVDQFLTGWRERAEFMSRQPGFRSFRLHRALTATAPFQLINVAEWDSADTLRAATAQQPFQDSVSRSLADFAVRGHPAIYRPIVEVRAASSPGPADSRTHDTE